MRMSPIDVSFGLQLIFYFVGMDFMFYRGVAVVSDFGNSVEPEHEYSIDDSMTEHRNLTRQEWQTRTIGQPVSTFGAHCRLRISDIKEENCKLAMRKKDG